jgi:hypothetical protein
MRRRPTLPAAIAVVVFVVGQLLALHHESTARHVTCAEHGEELEAPDLGASLDDGCGHSHWVGVEGGGSADHQDCAVARLLRTSASAPDAPHVHHVLALAEAVAATPVVTAARAIDVLLIAPKTSPPV